MWYCGIPYPLVVVVVINQSSNIHQNPKKQNHFQESQNTMAASTLSPATTSQVKENSPWCYISFVIVWRVDLELWMLLCLICFSYAPARVQCSLQLRPCLWCPGGPRWLVRAREWESHARQQFQLIMSQTWVRGSLWICFFWVLSHFPLVLCWFLMPLSLLHLGEFD